MQVRILSENEKKNIRPLYEEVFDDSQYFLDYYFDTYILKGINFVCEENRNIIGMATIHPKTIIASDKAYKAGYVYAVATHPCHRGKGIMKKILKEIEDYAFAREYEYLYLIPVNSAIYEGQGYKLLRDSTEREVLVKPENDIVIKKACREDVGKCVEFAEKLYKDRVSLLCDEEYFYENLERLSIKNSGIYCILHKMCDKILGLAFVDAAGEAVIENIICETMDLDTCMNAVGGLFKIDKLTYRQQAVMFKAVKESINNLINYSICINDEI